MIRTIDPIPRLGSRLLEVEKPGRYTGGEFGIYTKEGILRSVIVFPDLYELGMSNQAFRIIYNALNQIDGISCDRAFAPAPDFEKLLLEEDVPLYGLDTGIPLGDADLLLFTLGYELGITGILSVLDSSRIALRSAERSRDDPVVIMGGPCVSNPLPYSLFIDAFWIGEAEEGFFDLAKELLAIKKSGAARSDLLELIKVHPNVWTPGKTGVKRAIQTEFGNVKQPSAVFPVSSIRTVQHHGAVEIMRGCPNGCRFCHAGIWYRPMRQKRADLVLEEVENFVKLGGYREISLSSLSTGDYCHINALIDALNNRYWGRHISFQLPSLRVSGFSLPLLAKVSEVRKSGLTFAVETPAEMDQNAINKQVSLNEIISIIGEAKKNGWRRIKLYFMVGLPLGMPSLPLDMPDLLLGMQNPDQDEEKRIVDFVLEAGKATGIHFHLNLGTFVPKPHTPYQWAPQLDEEKAWQKFHYIQDYLKPRGHKVSVHNPLISLIEGIFSRGTDSSGLLAETAYKRGCRLDAWTDYFQAGIWKKILHENSAFVQTVMNKKENTEQLPWSVIQSGVGEAYLNNENEKSNTRKITSPCIENCTHPCGICGNNSRIVKNSIHDEVNCCAIHEKIEGNSLQVEEIKACSPDGVTYRMLFSFTKTGGGVFIPHLGVIEVFSSAVIRAKIPAIYTKGFNPLLKIDFASPASTGLTCTGEIAVLDLYEPVIPADFSRELNRALPADFSIKDAGLFTIPGGLKKYASASLLWGFLYNGNRIPAKEEKTYRLSVKKGKTIFGITRNGMLAKNPFTGEIEDYFELYQKLYPQIISA